jgi:hypothetical protein
MLSLTILRAHAFSLQSKYFQTTACRSTGTETELEAAVTQMFRRYGTVFVKIHQDPKNMPYAFYQFTVSIVSPYLSTLEFLEVHSRMMEMQCNALEDSKGRLIHGRPVRTERAKANRKFPCISRLRC